MKLVIDGVAIEVRDGVVFVNTGGPVSVIAQIEEK